MFREEPLPPEAEAFRNAYFAVRDAGKGCYDVWTTWGNTQYGLGTVEISQDGAAYTPYKPHSWRSGYEAAIKTAKGLGLRIL